MQGGEKKIKILTAWIISAHIVIGCRGKSMAHIRIEAFCLFTTSIICSYQVWSEQFPSLNIGLMAQRKAQFSENWKTHFLCFVVTKLSTDKRVHSINSWVIHLTIVLLCFPVERLEIWFEVFAEMSPQRLHAKAHAKNAKQSAKVLALCPQITLNCICSCHLKQTKTKKNIPFVHLCVYVQKGDSSSSSSANCCRQ